MSGESERAADDEALYRGHFLRSDARRSMVVIGVGILSNLLFVSNDLRLAGPGAPFHALVAVRCASALVGACVTAILLRSTSPQTHDRAMKLFLGVYVAVATYVMSTRPASYTGHAVPNLLLIVASYFVLAGPVLPRAATALAISASTVWFLLRGTADAAQKTMLVATHLLTQILGLSLVWKFERIRRDGFFAHLAEQRARAELADQARELAIARDRAESSAKARSDFLATMSHELRTPMNAVLGLSDVLDGTALTPAQRGLVRAIRSSAGSLFAVLADILDLADIEVRRAPPEHEPFAVREVAEGAIEMVRYQASDRGLAIELSAAPEVPASLVGDALRLRQILVHLLSNAISFSKKGTIVLEVKARALPVEAYELTFAAKDTGIAVTVRAGKGAAEALPAGAACAPSALAAPSKDLRVLVVDDNALNREVALAHLGRLGIAADVADSGREALAAIQRKEYDLILMDLRMPEMDGHETTRRIFATIPEEKRPRVIALTASTLESDRRACRAAGMWSFLTKPLHIEELRAVLLDAAPSVAPCAESASADAGAGAPLSTPVDGAPPAPAGAAPVPKLDPAALALLRELESPEAPDFLRTVCRKFVADARVRLDRLESAVTTGDAELAEREAHTLKTASATVGAREMSAACASLEAAARRRDLSGGAAAAAALRAELVLVEAALAEAIGGPVS